MMDLGETVARPADRLRVSLGSAGVLAVSLIVAPVVSSPLDPSYSIFAMVVAVSIVMLALTAILLWVQARVTASIPLLVLAAGYAATAATMVPWLALFHGLWPQLSDAVSADPQSPAWLWAEWHMLFALTPIAYVVARRAGRAVDAAAFRRLARIVSIGVAVGVAALVAPAIWIDGLPPFTVAGARTPLAWTVAGAVGCIVLVSLAMLARSRVMRSSLGVWLAFAAFCLIADVTMAQFGARTFSAGWYTSRAYILIASSSVLTALLGQTARIYASLGHTAARLRDETLTDALTGLANRRGFDARVTPAALGTTSVAVLMVDIDDFKRFNDAFGHPAGDATLRAIAIALRDSIMPARDTAARLGGEEFGIALAGTDIRGAVIVADRIRRAVERLAIQHAAGARRPIVTVSVGAAAGRLEETSMAELLALADRALYDAKRGGRNVTVAAPGLRTVGAV